MNLKNQGSERYTVFPIQYPTLWKYYKDHLATFWVPEEVRLTDDLVDWEKLDTNEQHFIKNILAFFAASDGIVNENLVLNFYNEVQIPEARNFYAVQMMIEAIHSDQYSILIDTYVTDSDEKVHLFSAVETIPAVKQKAEWAIKWIEEGSTAVQSVPPECIAFFKHLQSPDVAIHFSDRDIKALDFFTKPRPTFAQRLLAFICVEGIFFSGSFCAIYWLKSRGLMPGLATANQFISRDENLHTEFAIELYKLFDSPLSQDIVHTIFSEAVHIEKTFITESLPVSLIGMNCTLMKQYIEYVADRWLVLLGYSKLYCVDNPFPFMEMISVNTKSNFFEVNVDSYRRAVVGTTENDREIAFDDDDF